MPIELFPPKKTSHNSRCKGKRFGCGVESEFMDLLKCIFESLSCYPVPFNHFNAVAMASFVDRKKARSRSSVIAARDPPSR